MSNPARIAIVISVAAVSFFAGAWYNRKPAVGSPGGKRILYYHDPMHPAYRSDKPGIAPDCGMELEPVYEGEEDLAPASAPGAIQVSSEVRQTIGIRTAVVSRTPASHVLRVPGRVSLDERRIYRIAGAVDGWIRSSPAIAPGDIIAKGQLLATYYNRDFLTAQQTFLYALNTMDRFKDKENAEQLKATRAQMRAAEENLEFLGMDEAQIREIARTRQIARHIEVRAPVSGVLLARNVFTGLRFERGTELFRIAGIEHVWVYADIFERDAWLLPSTRKATVRYRGRAFPVAVSGALPQFDPASRTLKVRLELDNPGLTLRPDMFVEE